MTIETVADSPWMTRAEAAAYLRVGERTIDRYAAAGRLAKHRVEGVQSVRFSRTEVVSLVSEETAGRSDGYQDGLSGQ